VKNTVGETRKLAAVMAVDVVGYSRPMGEDEAGTVRAVRGHREAAIPIIAGLGGRIFKTMGDGLLLEFPSVVTAVECAVAIQKMMAAQRGFTRGEPDRLPHPRQSRRRVDRSRRYFRRRRGSTSSRGAYGAGGLGTRWAQAERPPLDGLSVGCDPGGDQAARGAAAPLVRR
jgi:class 3 adenylate cyclase